MTNSHVYRKFVHEALEWILLAPLRESSLHDRVFKVFKCAFGHGLQDKDFPTNVRADWRRIVTLGERAPKRKHSWMDNTTKARAYSLTRIETTKVLESFLKIAVAVIEQRAKD
jgi:hypothetical protein